MIIRMCINKNLRTLALLPCVLLLALPVLAQNRRQIPSSRVAGAISEVPLALDGMPLSAPVPLEASSAEKPRISVVPLQVGAALPQAQQAKAVSPKNIGSAAEQRLARAFDGSVSRNELAADSGDPAANQEVGAPAGGLPNRQALQAMLNQYAPVNISADLSKLPLNERQALSRIVKAAKIMDTIFLRQVWSGNEQLKAALMKDKTPLGAVRLAYFIKNMGAWDSLDNDKVFAPGAPAQKPPQGNFYPDDATKAEVEAWIKTLSSAEQEQARGFYTTVRRGPDGRLQLVPYSEEYKTELRAASALLDEAAALTAQPTLKAFLRARARAFLSNDYYASEVAWMELDSSVEPTIGPYEVYQDKWFNNKAAFEASIAVRDDAETAKLQQFSSHLQELEDNLPIPDGMKNPKLGAMSPIRVVDVVFSGGDANHGVQTAAFNLPNDERVTNEMGAKRVMLKNVQQAKFERVLLPISKVALGKADQALVSFDVFFTHILMHELMHGLGPHEIIVDGRKTTTRRELQEAYSAIEEAKADISGLWALQQMIDKNVLPKAMEKTMYVTYLASSFRTLRFGIDEAHGKGQALQLNTFLDKGAVTVNADGTFSVDHSKIIAVVRDLTTELLIIEARGDKAAAQKLLAERGVIGPSVQAVLDQLKDVPVDIAPQYVTAGDLGLDP